MNALPFALVWEQLYRGKRKAAAAFIAYLERKLGGRFVYERSAIAYGEVDLLDLITLAEKMIDAKVISSYARQSGLPDEPPVPYWSADIIEGKSSGGFSVEGDRRALTAALAEALERHLWRSVDDYFESPERASSQEIQAKGRALSPESFAGFSAQQREKNKRRHLTADARYLWIRGESFIDNKRVWVPAQIVSGKYGIESSRTSSEPIIREPITTGLATGPTREFALLNGALEVLERDAFMITWLNQLTPPRISLPNLRKTSALLDTLLSLCERYSLRVDVALLPTDAPVNAVCAIVSDATKMPPRSIGLKAHPDVERAAVGAIQEALRMRLYMRHLTLHKPLEPSKKIQEIVHTERLTYWAQGEKYRDLDFLVSGNFTEPRPTPTGNSPSLLLGEIVDWCREKQYSIASVPLTSSQKNVTDWHVEMVVMPELIPVHQNEKSAYDGGERRVSVPKQFGFEPRAQPFFEEPHPFA